MKRRIIIIAYLLIGIVFGGCTMNNGKSSLEHKLLKLMHNKYDIDFEIVEDSYEEYPLTNILVATLSPADNPDIQCTGSLNTLGLFEDNYSTSLLQNQLKEYYSVLCDQEYVFDYDIIVEGHSTRDDLTGLSFEEYVERREYYVTLKVQLYDGKTDDEYADEIYSLISAIDSFDGDVYMLSIYLSDNIMIYCDNLYCINAEQGQGMNYYTHEFLLHEIHDNRQNSILLNRFIEGEV